MNEGDRRWIVLQAAVVGLAAGGAAGCFTGDELRGQPCRTDADCNAVADALGGRLSCQEGVCGVVCGDGVVFTGVEECEDANDVITDDCVLCRHATCGDGAVWEGREECDDGDDDDTDACARCMNAACGDGFTWAGEEDCDDGNDIDDDGCAECRFAVCGDGVENPRTEACDDGDGDEDDGCNTACEMGAERLSTGPLASHTCVVRRGALRCWGFNGAGQLGHGNRATLGDEPSDLPLVDVPVGAPVMQVVAGASHTCVIVDAPGDNVRCWGSNEAGAVGLPGPEIFIGDEAGELPARAVEVGDTVVQLAAGSHHTCAVLVDGGVRCWGGGGELSNGGAELGYGFLIPGIGDDEDPADHGPVRLGGPAIQLAAGEVHTCALLVDGAVRCWGHHLFGQLGYPEASYAVGDDDHPEEYGPVRLGGRALQISAGAWHTCALLVDGAVRCWGLGDQGQLGPGSGASVGDDEYPESFGPVELGGAAVQVAAGAYHTCALLAGGAVRCWGDGSGGKLGLGDDANIGDDESPTAVPPLLLGGPTRELAAFASHTCARLESGEVRCWGANGGTLGLGHVRTIGDEPGEMPPAPAILYEFP